MIVKIIIFTLQTLLIDFVVAVIYIFLIDILLNCKNLTHDRKTKMCKYILFMKLFMINDVTKRM